MKVYYKYFSRAFYKIVIFPEIRLAGKWLKETGFDCGDNIMVWHKKDKIIITKYKEKEDTVSKRG